MFESKVTSVFSWMAASSGSSKDDVIDTDCLRKFLNAVICNRLKSIYVYVARDAGGEARFSCALTSGLRNRLAKSSPPTGAWPVQA